MALRYSKLLFQTESEQYVSAALTAAQTFHASRLGPLHLLNLLGLTLFVLPKFQNWSFQTQSNILQTDVSMKQNCSVYDLD